MHIIFLGPYTKKIRYSRDIRIMALNYPVPVSKEDYQRIMLKTKKRMQRATSESREQIQAERRVFQNTYGPLYDRRKQSQNHLNPPTYSSIRSSPTPSFPDSDDDQPSLPSTTRPDPDDALTAKALVQQELVKTQMQASADEQRNLRLALLLTREDLELADLETGMPTELLHSDRLSIAKTLFPTCPHEPCFLCNAPVSCFDFAVAKSPDTGSYVLHCRTGHEEAGPPIFSLRRSVFRAAVWYSYMGPASIEGVCKVCCLDSCRLHALDAWQLCHDVARSLGGDMVVSNVVPGYARCNLSQRVMTLQQFRARHGVLAAPEGGKVTAEMFLHVFPHAKEVLLEQLAAPVAAVLPAAQRLKRKGVHWRVEVERLKMRRIEKEMELVDKKLELVGKEMQLERFRQGL